MKRFYTYDGIGIPSSIVSSTDLSTNVAYDGLTFDFGRKSVWTHGEEFGYAGDLLTVESSIRKQPSRTSNYYVDNIHIGSHNKISYTYTNAVGMRTYDITTDNYGEIFGDYVHNEAIYKHSAAFGTGNGTSNENEFIIGQYAKTYTNALSNGAFGPYNDSTLFAVGNGSSSANRHNAFQIMQDGTTYVYGQLYADNFRGTAIGNFNGAFDGNFSGEFSGNFAGNFKGPLEGSITYWGTYSLLVANTTYNVVSPAKLFEAIKGIDNVIIEDEEITSAALNELNNRVGDITTLTTPESSNVVNSINYSYAYTHTNVNKLNGRIDDAFENIAKLTENTQKADKDINERIDNIYLQSDAFFYKGTYTFNADKVTGTFSNPVSATMPSQCGYIYKFTNSGTFMGLTPIVEAGDYAIINASGDSKTSVNNGNYWDVINTNLNLTNTGKSAKNVTNNKRIITNAQLSSSGAFTYTYYDTTGVTATYIQSFNGGSFTKGNFDGGSFTQGIDSFTAATHGADSFTAATHGADSFTAASLTAAASGTGNVCVATIDTHTGSADNDYVIVFSPLTFNGGSFTPGDFKGGSFTPGDFKGGSFTQGTDTFVKPTHAADSFTAATLTKNDVNAVNIN